MIFVSTPCVKAERIDDAVKKLVDFGFSNIELSGGTERYIGFEKDLIRLKGEYNLNFLLHNYFPPPTKHLVLNLASLNDDIYNASLNHYKRAIELSVILGAKKFGLHAGFLIDPKVNELGKGITKQKPYDREEAIQRFCSGYTDLTNHSDEVEIYIENNVFSQRNLKNFSFNPFLLTNYDTYLELYELIKFPLLLDVAHLKVSCCSLGLDFKTELLKLYEISDYVHLSDNDGHSDSNNTILPNSFIFNFLMSHTSKGKSFTLEIYDDLRIVKTAYNNLSKMIKEY